MTDETTAVETAQDPQPEQPNGVLVVRNFDESGRPSVDVMPLGDVRITEIERILKMGIHETARALEG